MEEEHSTRGRARLLFEMLNGHGDSPISDGWRSDGGPRRAGPVPGLQGLQEGLPGRRGHGHLQGRVPRASLAGPAMAAAAVGPLAGLAARRSPRLWPATGLAAAVNAVMAARPGLHRLAAWLGGVEPRQFPPVRRARTCSAGTRGPRAAGTAGAARCCCGRTPSPTTSTRTSARPRSRCWRRQAGGSISRGSRCAAGSPGSPPASSASPGAGPARRPSAALAGHVRAGRLRRRPRAELHRRLPLRCAGAVPG